jgi:hypothetical protein
MSASLPEHEHPVYGDLPDAQKAALADFRAEYETAFPTNYHSSLDAATKETIDLRTIKDAFTQFKKKDAAAYGAQGAKGLYAKLNAAKVFSIPGGRVELTSRPERKRRADTPDEEDIPPPPDEVEKKPRRNEPTGTDAKSRLLAAIRRLVESKRDTKKAARNDMMIVE